MAETDGGSDLSLGTSLIFGFVAVVAAAAMAWTAFVSEAEGSETMQLLSGVAFTVALVAGAIAVAAPHLFE